MEYLNIVICLFWSRRSARHIDAFPTSTPDIRRVTRIVIYRNCLLLTSLSTEIGFIPEHFNEWKLSILIYDIPCFKSSPTAPVFII